MKDVVGTRREVSATITQGITKVISSHSQILQDFPGTQYYILLSQTKRLGACSEIWVCNGSLSPRVKCTTPSNFLSKARSFWREEVSLHGRCCMLLAMLLATKYRIHASPDSSLTYVGGKSKGKRCAQLVIRHLKYDRVVRPSVTRVTWLINAQMEDHLPSIR